MHLIPYEKFEIQTSFSESQILQKIDGMIDKRKWWFLPPKDCKDFRGRIVERHFKIYRVIRHRNSFLPLICGKVQGSSVRITMRLHHAVAVFMVIWFGFILLAIGTSISPVVYNDSSFLGTIIVPFAMLILAYLMVMWEFHSDAKKSKNILLAAFKPS